MAKQSLAVSPYHRNSNLGIVSTNFDAMHKKGSSAPAFHHFPADDLSTVLGLAFTAIMAHGVNVTLCRFEMNIFLKHRDCLHDDEWLDVITPSVMQILECGWTAFKALGFPSYYDDFIWSYHYLLNSRYLIPLPLKHEMQRLLYSMQ